MLDEKMIARPAVLAPAVLLVGYIAYQLLLLMRQRQSMPKLPVIGVRQGELFSLVRARWRNALDFKAAILQAETRFPGQAVIVPLTGTGDLVLLPRSDIQFVVDQPDTVLNMHTQVEESLQIDYTVTDPNLVHNPVHHHLITTTLTNQVGNLVPDVADETAWSVDRHWGVDTDRWTDVCVFETMCGIIGSVTNRVFVGLPYCRDPALLREGMSYARRVPMTAQLLRMFWAPVRPLAALFTTLPIWRTTRRFERILRPEIERRLAAHDARARDPEAKGQHHGPDPNDFLQWSIRQAKESGDPYMWRPSTLAGRVLLLNFAAIHTSSFSITSAILDLVSSRQEYIDALRAEIEGVLAEHGGVWNKRALAKMVKLDSVMRESARLNSFVTVGLSRRVVAEDGVTTPSGAHLPRGTTIAVPSYSVLRDDAVYPDADQFKPFRFSDERRDESVDYVKRAAKSFATTSKDYLAFGHGRNACPGRFFAANELKLMLAHIVTHYDFELTDSRPRNKWFGLNRIPPMQARIRVKRRVS